MKPNLREVRTFAQCRTAGKWPSPTQLWQMGVLGLSSEPCALVAGSTARWLGRTGQRLPAGLTWVLPLTSVGPWAGDFTVASYSKHRWSALYTCHSHLPCSPHANSHLLIWAGWAQRCSLSPCEHGDMSVYSSRYLKIKFFMFVHIYVICEQ